jgi:hypothetical protein
MSIGGATLLSLVWGLVSLPSVHAQPSAPQVQPPVTTAGKYERITVHGASLEGNLEGDSPDRMVSLYLPPSYARDTHRRYPLLYLHAMSPCCVGANLAPNAQIMERAAKVQTAEEIAQADFGTKAMLASAAAWSPDPAHPPSFLDLPMNHGTPVQEIIAEWAANAPLAMVQQYIPGLRSYAAIAFDAGDKDVGIAESVRILDKILTGYGVAHVFEIYDGNHVSRIHERFETHVLPFFSAHLQFH